jgi:D-aminopeptidase
MSALALAKRVDAAISALAHRYPGPGGAAAVVYQGEIVARRAWGFANSELRLAFTPRTLFRICSITKQFTCALALETFPDLEALDEVVAARLPRLEGPPPHARDMAHNQSGLRDYWALAMLHGAPAELPFGEIQAREVIARNQTRQFAPGSRYSYSNQNFRLLGDAVCERRGEGLADLLRREIFAPSGMETAFLAADTRAMPDGTEGYEGDVASGFRPARNNIVWTGDAGIGASLDDMIAWERRIDAERDDPDSLYHRLSAPVTFADGAPAAYGFGLGRAMRFERRLTNHGGALRGWRSHRLHSAADRLSVVVLFNHLSDAASAAHEILAAALDIVPAPQAPAPEAFRGAWIEPETGLSLRFAREGALAVRMKFGHSPELFHGDGDGGLTDGESTLSFVEGALKMTRARDHLSTTLRPLEGTTRDTAGCAGRFHCAELDADLQVVDAGGTLYGGFSGFLGQGRMELLAPVGPDVWALPCPRALDHTPPGDWTLAFHRTGDGRASSVQVGCWLARGLTYERVD